MLASATDMASTPAGRRGGEGAQAATARADATERFRAKGLVAPVAALGG